MWEMSSARSHTPWQCRRAALLKISLMMRKQKNSIQEIHKRHKNICRILRLSNERKLEGMKEKWWNQNPNKAEVSANFHPCIHTFIFKRYQILYIYITFLFERTVKKMRRIPELSPSKTWAVSSLSYLLASSLLSSPLDLSSVTSRRKITLGCSLLWSVSQDLVKMLRRNKISK